MVTQGMLQVTEVGEHGAAQMGSGGKKMEHDVWLDNTVEMKLSVLEGEDSMASIHIVQCKNSLRFLSDLGV